MRCYVLNLTTQRGRYKKQLPELQKVGLEPQRVRSVRYVGDEGHEEIISRFPTGIWHNMAHQMRGMALSHCKAALEFMKSGEDMCLILEDDAFPVAQSVEEFEASVKGEIPRVPNGWWTIQLHADCPIPGLCMKNTSGACVSTAAYLLSREGAAHILDNPVLALDWGRAWRRAQGDPLFSVQENLFWTDESTSATSGRDHPSLMYRALDNVRGNAWAIRGQKSAAYILKAKWIRVLGTEPTMEWILVGLFSVLAAMCSGPMRFAFVAVALCFFPL